MRSAVMRLKVNVFGTTPPSGSDARERNTRKGLADVPSLSELLKRTQAAVAVLSYGFWTRTFGADPRIVGTELRVSGLPVTIVGVTPPEFTGVVVGTRTDFSMPLTTVTLVRPELTKVLTQRSAHWLQVMGRLKSGQTLESTNAGFQTVWPRVLVASAPSGTLPSSSFHQEKRELLPGAMGLSDLRATYSSPLYVLMALVAVVLLVACANVGNLLLARPL
jgi:MacB-like periplasmic core domain